MEREIFSINDFIKEVVLKKYPLLQEKGIKIYLNLHEDYQWPGEIPESLGNSP